MKSKKFQRNIEDFICGHCGLEVKGSGYTNHCPDCLWSKHVDVNPGDRASECGGLMEPVASEGSSNNLVIVHECVKCGYKKRNKVSVNDDIGELAKVALKTFN
ncbi:MAG: RNHCP domain-containing protein [Candidatus Komeilibacteria bacterium]